MTSPIYDRLMSEVDDDLERKVLHVLLTHAGERVSRPDLVLAVMAVTRRTNKTWLVCFR
jgi:hypothetical protein